MDQSEEMFKLVREWRKSGVSQSEFCKPHGITVAKFGYWVGREVFIFLNRARTHLKMLHWEPGGFVLYYKRLESGTFPLPQKIISGNISWTDLVLMIEGIKVLKSSRRKRFTLQQ